MTTRGAVSDGAPAIRSEQQLVAIALRLGAAEISGWSRAETLQAKRSDSHRDDAVARSSTLRDQIRDGADPLGEALLALRSAAERRGTGAIFTPEPVVESMFGWARTRAAPERVVDPGAGSGRFLMAAARSFPGAQLVGIEIDPVTAILARANLAVVGAAKRARIELRDFRSADVRSSQRTLFIGNPPYVRHHLIGRRWKNWFASTWRRFGIQASQLAGLHVHFFLATLMQARPGDDGAYITAAEWLDVNYGECLRKAFLTHLGGEALIRFAPASEPFSDAASTAAISLFQVGSKPSRIRMREVRQLASLNDLSGGRSISRARFECARRWSQLTRIARARSRGLIELGEICRVHRGQATGANSIWIAGENAENLPARVLFPAVTRAREIILAGRILATAAPLRNVIDIPADLEELTGGEDFDGRGRAAVERFLRAARKRGAHLSYLARHRRAWWSVGLRAPAPILATYMARRPPVFALNAARARHLNIAHGLYPREPLTQRQLLALVDHLSSHVSVADGRTYAGGLTKFEPGEMERLWVPRP